jgi:hypothetical protein
MKTAPAAMMTVVLLVEDGGAEGAHAGAGEGDHSAC